MALNGLQGASRRTYDIGGLVKLSMPDGLCPVVEHKIEHWGSNGEEHDILIDRATDPVQIEFNPDTGYSRVNNECRPVVIGVGWLADMMRAADGCYELVSKKGLYTISPGRITCSGETDPLYFEHMVLRSVINNHLVPKGSLIAHAAAVAIDGKILVFLGESSKTSILLELMTRGAAFVADEYALLERSGRCVMYSPWMWMEERHLTMFPELMDTVYPDRLQRNGVKKRSSFNHLADSIGGGNPISRRIREFFKSNFWYEGILCHSIRPFPNSALVESGHISHIFHLDANKEGGIVEAEAADIARIETAAHTIKLGHHKVLADLAGIRHYAQSEINDVLTEALSHAGCHRIHVDAREKRDRARISQIVDNALSVI